MQTTEVRGSLMAKPGKPRNLEVKSKKKAKKWAVSVTNIL